MSMRGHVRKILLKWNNCRMSYFHCRVRRFCSFCALLSRYICLYNQTKLDLRLCPGRVKWNSNCQHQERINCYANVVVSLFVATSFLYSSKPDYRLIRASLSKYRLLGAPLELLIFNLLRKAWKRELKENRILRASVVFRTFRLGTYIKSMIDARWLWSACDWRLKKRCIVKINNRTRPF